MLIWQKVKEELTITEEMFIIYAVSDSIGETSENMAKAAASQFNSSNFDIIRISHLTTIEQIDKIIEEAGKRKCMICYTLVSEELRLAFEERVAKSHIIAVDLLSPLIRNIEKMSGLKSKNKPGLIHALDTDYFKRVEAVEFAVKYDDGKNPWGLMKADIVLLGVSRTSKTPLSMYLANKRLKVANVPLVPELMPPEELFKLPANKIVGLIINPYKLNEIRSERLKAMGLDDSANYADLNRINEELEYAKAIMRKLHCLVIDVSNRAIEETANTILEYAQKNKLID